MTGRIAIDSISPSFPLGHYPSKAVVDEYITVSSTVWREGHDAVGARVVCTGPTSHASYGQKTISSTSDKHVLPAAGESSTTEKTRKKGTAGKKTADKKQTITIRMNPAHREDHYLAVFSLPTEGLWSFYIEAFSDVFSTWVQGLEKKLAAQFTPEQLSNELSIGHDIFLSAARQYKQFASEYTHIADNLLNTDLTLPERTSVALSESVREQFYHHPVCELTTKSPKSTILVERKRSLFGSWYEFFPRSTGGFDHHGNPTHGTFSTAQKQLPRISNMGFDVVYLPPIHPIGYTNRKGPNNSLEAGPNDVGSPWAIGSTEGGHDAIHPDLGTYDDFVLFVEAARDNGLEVALDFALQCSPDHPWAQEHPEWFTTLPDGTIAYAENPPKKYQDIYPINFDKDPEGIYQASLDVLLHWIKAGVTIFRVDNPHTKPANFWEWIISTVKKTHPEIIFLSEAFTRPARMYGLARRGFTQSYTYFTWRTSQEDLINFAVDIAKNADQARPNLFTNTPDILHASLQFGGQSAFAQRAVLAATLSPTWGIYSGFELFEHQAVSSGSEEYLDSEKYQLRPRNYSQALAEGNSLEPWIGQLNYIRNQYPAFQQLRNIYFHTTHHENLLAYTKFDISSGNLMLVVVNINPHDTHEGLLHLNMDMLGQNGDAQFEVIDVVDGSRYWWGAQNYIRLDPARAVCHIFVLPPVEEKKRQHLGELYFQALHS